METGEFSAKNKADMPPIFFLFNFEEPLRICFNRENEEDEILFKENGI